MSRVPRPTICSRGHSLASIQTKDSPPAKTFKQVGKPALGLRDATNIPVNNKLHQQPQRKIAVATKTHLAVGQKRSNALNVPKTKDPSFNVYCDNENKEDEYNVVKQLEKLDRKGDGRLPLEELHPKFFIGESNDDLEGESSSQYDSAVEGPASEYFSALPSPPNTPETADRKKEDLPEDMVDDMYVYMREREKSFGARADYLRKQEDLNENMRTVLIDWLNDVVLEFAMETETLHLAVSLVDRLCSVCEVSRLHLQLVGTAALMIASKYELIYPPELREFVYVTDDSYTESQILKMERRILNNVAFDVSVPTAQWFVSHFCRKQRVSQKTTHLCNYFVDLSLLSVVFLRFKPSIIAAASFCASVAMTDGQQPWPRQLEKETGICVSLLKDAIVELMKMFDQSSTMESKSMYEKYAHDSLCSVSTLPALSETILSTLSS